MFGTFFDEFGTIESSIDIEFGDFVFLLKIDFLEVVVFVRHPFCTGIEFCVPGRIRTRHHTDARFSNRTKTMF